MATRGRQLWTLEYVDTTFRNIDIAAPTHGALDAPGPHHQSNKPHGPRCQWQRLPQIYHRSLGGPPKPKRIFKASAVQVPPNLPPKAKNNTRDLCARIRGRLSQRRSGPANCNIIHPKNEVWKCPHILISSLCQTTRLFGRGYSRCLQSKSRKPMLVSPKHTESQCGASLPHSQANVRASAKLSLSSTRPAPTLKCVRNFQTIPMRM